MKNAKWYLLCLAGGLILGFIGAYFLLVRPARAESGELRRINGEIVAELEANRRYSDALVQSLDDANLQLGKLFSTIQRINATKTKLERDNLRLGKANIEYERLLREYKDRLGERDKLLEEARRINSENIEIIQRLQSGSGQTNQAP
jgi:hypothetical protein